MTTDKELEAMRPCPFCGAHAEMVGGRIRCANIYNCDAETRLSATAWNRRVSPVEQQQQESSRERVLEEARNVCIAFKAELGTLPAYIADLEAALQGSALPKAQ